jgi:hypothetical protein
MLEDQLGPGEQWIYSMYITVKGKKVYRKNGKPFRFKVNKRKRS